MLNDLPSEIAFRIMLYLSCKDIMNLRLVSFKMRAQCDQPCIWRSIILQPSSPSPAAAADSHTDNRAVTLWKLIDLRNIIDVHLEHIRSIQIWGARDNIVHYLLSSCPNLQHLIIRGWTTLSDHCLRVLSSRAPLRLKTLRLIGASEQMNFVSVNACTLGNLLIQTPGMTELVFHCEMHIHADYFLNELEQKMLKQQQQQQQQQQRTETDTVYDLKCLILAARSSGWLRDHVLRLIRIFPNIQKICLMSTTSVYAHLYDEFEDHNLLPEFHSEQLDPWLIEQSEKALKMNGNSPRVTDSIASIPLITTDSMILYDRALLCAPTQ